MAVTSDAEGKIGACPQLHALVAALTPARSGKGDRLALIVSPRKRSTDNEQLVERQAFKQTIGSHDRHQPTLLERVYVLLDREACQVKIGWTTRSVEGRRRAIQTATGRKLDLIGSMRGGYNLERCMHARFRDYRAEQSSPEWFSTEILAELIPLLDAA